MTLHQILCGPGETWLMGACIWAHPARLSRTSFYTLTRPREHLQADPPTRPEHVIFLRPCAADCLTRGAAAGSARDQAVVLDRQRNRRPAFGAVWHQVDEGL